MPTKSLCVLRFEDASFERDLRGTLDDLVADGWEVSVHRLGDDGALLECRRPTVEDGASRRDLGLAGAIARAAFEAAGADPDWIDRCCAVSAAVDLARTRDDAELGVAFGVLRKIRSRLEKRGRTSRAQVIALVIDALATCDRWVLS